MILLYGHDQTVADWVSKKWGKSIPPWYFALGILDKEGLLKGGVTFHNYNGNNIELCYYGPRTLSKDVVRGITDFLVNKIKIQRVTVSIPRRNKLLIKSVTRLGAKQEGVLRHFYGPYRNDDAIVFGMLNSEMKRFLS